MTRSSTSRQICSQHWIVKDILIHFLYVGKNLMLQISSCIAVALLSTEYSCLFLFVNPFRSSKLLSPQHVPVEQPAEIASSPKSQLHRHGAISFINVVSPLPRREFPARLVHSNTKIQQDLRINFSSLPSRIKHDDKIQSDLALPSFIRHDVRISWVERLVLAATSLEAH